MDILLVEDSRTSVLMVSSLLDDDPTEDYQLTVAGTVAQAREHLQNHEFDLILLDLTLPDSSGLATVDSVFEVAKGTGIVVLTSISDEQVGLSALKHGAQDFLIKDETYRKVLLRAVKYARQRSISERDVREAREMAEFATKSKSSFIANLSHELRTPLNAVIGFSELMMNGLAGDLDDKQREYLNDIHKSGQYLHGLIGTVLDLSKIEADRLDVSEEQVSLSAVVEDVIETTGQSYTDAKVNMVADVSDHLPVLKGDATKIRQIVTNLVTNAVKYSPDGGEVNIKVFLSDRGDMVLEVSDQGIGIPQEDINKILQPFERTQVSKDRKIEGTGLGLPLTKGLVEAHGGSITIDSEVGVGTTATVKLPAGRVLQT
ncbi:hybrid sensor histidine kinase/response regulator [Magnetovibrio sp. PR-2]|uniref:hybrid sensor histidine kinase/response regulator n=1 Tax=Magnetovibrio sp. PR-2 TaxID=3120356 RepID=UPI002FCE076B